MDMSMIVRSISRTSLKEAVPLHLDQHDLTPPKGRKGKKYLQSAKRLFRKSGAKIIGQKLRDKIETIDLQPTIDEVMKSRRNVRMIADREATTLVIGHPQYGEFAHSVSIRSPQYAPGMLEPKMMEQLIGLRIVLVPWIDGWLLLP